MEYTSALNDNFDAVGFGSLLFLYNLGSLAIAIAALPVLIGIIIITYPFKKINKAVFIRYN
jgi:ABC-type bacteriocin/lantibiotic exporter with double-glycine peptidase domain